jgi:chitin disaccharide deacetylase
MCATSRACRIGWLFVIAALGARIVTYAVHQGACLGGWQKCAASRREPKVASLTKRWLIVNADDFGLSAGVNRGVAEAHDKGIVTSASLMVHGPGAAEAAALARNRPLLSLGLHIDVGEWRYENGHWATVYERAPQNDPKALKAALDEQLDLFRRLVGAKPTHFDSHQHVHTHNPLRSIVHAQAAQLDIPVRHFSTEVWYCGHFYGQDEEGRPNAERLRASFLVDIINALNHDITELGCHPAAALDFQSCYRKERLKELKALCSPVVAQAIEHTRVVLTSFAELRHLKG